ncbi:MAG: 4-hydroxy-tetrahydrodipicolinate reductase, partial [Nitrospirae bacterium]|nr:4-hydroxy-tetrahydrodipicolinate reductase [Nitrospirota bacterium]
MNRIVVTGAAGRMGSQIVSAVLDARDLKMGGATERKGHPSFGKDIGDLIGRGKLGVLLTDRLEAVLPGAQAMIDFTTPEGTIEHLGHAAENNVPTVIGTTGFS